MSRRSIDTDAAGAALAAAEVTAGLTARTPGLDRTLSHPLVRITSASMSDSPIALARAWALAHPDAPACEVQVRRPQRKGKGGWGTTEATWTLHAVAGQAFRPAWPRDGWCGRCGAYTREGADFALLEPFGGVITCLDCTVELANCAHARVSVVRAWRCDSAAPLYNVGGVGEICVHCLHAEPLHYGGPGGAVPEERLNRLADLVFVGAWQGDERLAALRERFGERFGKDLGRYWRPAGATEPAPAPLHVG